MTRAPRRGLINWLALLGTYVFLTQLEPEVYRHVAVAATPLGLGQAAVGPPQTVLRGVSNSGARIHDSRERYTPAGNHDSDEDRAEKWDDWQTSLDPDSSWNLIFSSVSGLLQHWHNARYRNGHTVVPATIPFGTLLYHGRSDIIPPASFEWLSFDFEHSYMFCISECHMITYVATRPLKVLYIDGSSAAKMEGPMDSQQIIVHGNVKSERTWEEAERIRGLCAWGEEFGLDGFLRMEFNFEVLWCDFNNGLEMTSNRKLLKSTWGDPPPGPGEPTPTTTHTFPHQFPAPTGPAAPPGWVGTLRSRPSVRFEAVQSGSWHNHPPGIGGVAVDYSRMITFFDPRYQSLVGARKAVPRTKYRLANISSEDARLFASDIRSVLTREGSASGVAWSDLLRNVVDRHAQRLEYLAYILNSSSTDGAAFDATAVAARVRQHVLMMLSPYLLWTAVSPAKGAVPSRSERWANTTWLSDTMRHCTASFTSAIPLSILTAQEVLIHGAIEGTMHEICRTLGVIWVDAFVVEKLDASEAALLVEKWRADVSRLMDWLDWSVWVRCEPECGPERLCSIPQWPFDFDKEGADTKPRCFPREFTGGIPLW